MNKTIHLIFRIISIIFIALGVIFIALVWLKGDKTLEGDVELQNKILSPFITMTLIELGLGTLLAFLFPLAFTSQNGKGLIKGLIYLAALAVLALISYYGLSGNAFSPEDLQRLEVTADLSRLVGAAVYFTYFIGGAAVLVILYSGVASMFKK